LRPRLLISTVLAGGALALAGCGGTAPGTEPPAAAHAPRGAGSIHATAQTSSGQTRNLTFEYAAAGLSGANPATDDTGSLIIVGIFRDGRVDDALDLETLSISVPLSELPGHSGALDTVVDGSALNVLLEGSADSETRLLAPDAVAGQLHLRYDAPPRPGITMRGDFTLTVRSGTTTVPGTTLTLEGEFEVPVLGG
jgi:hypothetical protein